MKRLLFSCVLMLLGLLPGRGVACDCETVSHLYIWPSSPSIQPEQLFVLNAKRAGWLNFAHLFRDFSIYLYTHDQKVRLDVIDTIITNTGDKQALLKPRGRLLIGEHYRMGFDDNCPAIAHPDGQRWRQAELGLLHNLLASLEWQVKSLEWQVEQEWPLDSIKWLSAPRFLQCFYDHSDCQGRGVVFSCKLKAPTNSLLRIAITNGIRKKWFYTDYKDGPHYGSNSEGITISTNSCGGLYEIGRGELVTIDVVGAKGNLIPWRGPPLEINWLSAEEELRRPTPPPPKTKRPRRG